MGLIIPDARSASIHVQGRSEIFRVLADAGAKSLLRPGWEGLRQSLPGGAFRQFEKRLNGSCFSAAPPSSKV